MGDINEQVATPRHFTNPAEIKQFGQIVNNFSNAGKNLARFLSLLEIPQEDILRLVGRGRYNTLEAQGYVLQGPEAHKSARDNIEGLFGAFFYVHLPELRMAMQLPKLMGDAGCKLTTKVNGQTYQIPLGEVKFGFRAEPPAIVLDEDVALVAGDSKQHVLRKGTVVLSGGRQTKLQKQNAIDVVDKENRSLSVGLLHAALWGQQGARGMKSLPRNPERAALMFQGTDDDITAEEYMIDALHELKSSHNIDLMSEFNRFVVAAHDGIVARPALIQSCVDAIAVCDAIAAKEVPDAPSYGDYDNHRNLSTYRASLLRAREVSAGIQEMLVMLGLDESKTRETSLETKEVIARLNEALPKALTQAMRKDDEDRVQREKQRIAFEKQCAENRRLARIAGLRSQLSQHLRLEGDVLDVEALRKGGGNKLKKPHTWHLERHRIAKALETLEGEPMSLSQLAAESYQQMAMRTLDDRLQVMRDYMGSLPRQAWFRERETRYPELMCDWRAVLTKASSALEGIQQGMKSNPPQINRLREHAEIIKKAVEQLDETFAKEGVQSRGHSQVKPIFGSNEQRTISIAKSQWSSKRAAGFKNLIKLLEAVEYDPSRWMALYGNVEGILQKDTAENQTPTFAEGLRARGVPTNAEQTRMAG